MHFIKAPRFKKKQLRKHSGSQRACKTNVERVFVLKNITLNCLIKGNFTENQIHLTNGEYY